MTAGKNKKIFDVTKPGKTKPSATSRPVIVGHGPMIEDPMVQRANGYVPTAPEIQEQEKDDQHLPLQPTQRSKKILSPPSEEQVSIPADNQKDSTKDHEGPVPRSTIEDEKPAGTTKTEQPVGAGESNDTDPSSSIETKEHDDKKELENQDAISEYVTTQDHKKTKVLSQEEQDRQAAIQQMIEDKTYFLPIKQAKRRRRHNQILLLIVVVVVLAIAVVYFLVATGMLQTSIQLPYLTN